MQSEAELLVLAAQGDEELYLARALEANMGLIVERASRSQVSGYEHAELISEMRIAAIKAIRAYEEDKGEWSTYLYRCLKHRMGALIKHKQNKMRYKMDAMCELFDGYELGTYEHNWCRYWPIEGLSTRDSVLLELYYLWGNRMREIGVVCGLKERAVQWRIQVALKRARALVA